MINVFNPVNRYSANDAKLYIWNAISIAIDTLKNDNSQSYILFQILYTKSCSYFFKPTLQYKSELRRNKNIAILESLNSTKSTQRVKNILTQ